MGPWWRPLAIHDPGKVVLDLAVAVPLGGDAAADVAVLRAHPDVFGLGASDPTVSRLVERLATDVDAAEGGPRRPTFLLLVITPVMLATVPLARRAPGTRTAALTALCAVLLVTHVVVTGLSIGLLFAPAAITLLLLAVARASRPVPIE